MIIAIFTVVSENAQKIQKLYLKPEEGNEVIQNLELVDVAAPNADIQLDCRWDSTAVFIGRYTYLGVIFICLNQNQ
jgi:hypothetical protein